MEKKVRIPFIPAILMVFVLLGQISGFIANLINIVGVQRSGNPDYYPRFYFLFTVVLALAGIGIGLALCIALFAKARKGLLATIFAGQILVTVANFALQSLYLRVYHLKSFLQVEVTFKNICVALLSCLLSVAAFAAIAGYVLIISKNPPKFVKALFFVPATLQFLAVSLTNIASIINWVEMLRQLVDVGVARSYIIMSTISTFSGIVGSYLFVIVLFGLGWWLKNPYAKEKSVPTAAPAPAPAAKSAAESVDVTVDALKKYKDLLDSGIITPEEFDAKKKEILGL